MRYICCNQFCFFAFYAVSPSRIYITVSNQTNDKIKVHIKENRDEKKWNNIVTNKKPLEREKTTLIRIDLNTKLPTKIWGKENIEAR